MQVLSEGVTEIVQVGTTPSTVTVAAQVDVRPTPSITVSVTGIVLPASAQVNEFGVTLTSVTGPQLSWLPLSTIAGVSVAVPPERVTVAFLQRATGGVLSTTVTLKLQVLLPPAFVKV